MDLLIDLLKPFDIRVPTIIAIRQDMKISMTVSIRMLFAWATMMDSGTRLQSMTPEVPIF